MNASVWRNQLLSQLVTRRDCILVTWKEESLLHVFLGDTEKIGDRFSTLHARQGRVEGMAGLYHLCQSVARNDCLIC